MIKRVFLIVLDSFGIGETPDAKDYKDQGSNTLKSVMSSKNFSAYNLTKLGLLNIDGIDFAPDFPSPCASYARCLQKSKGKDTVTGHWEIAGIISDTAMPVYPYGFPKELIDEFEAKTG
jgi:phosphopentomutase